MQKLNIAFVAHEFGLYPGHGGIASYLYNICKYLLENTSHNIYIIVSGMYDIDCSLTRYKNFYIEAAKDDHTVYNLLQKITPDYVEVADYLALGLYSIFQKRLGNGLQKTVFAVHHHTASRECFEWNSMIPIKYANEFIKESYMKEKLQILLADLQISPSEFMSNYVKKNYDIIESVYYFNHINIVKNETKEEIESKIKEEYNLSEYEDTFNIFLISRIEGRKNQELLIDQFIKFKNKEKIDTHLFLIGNSNRDEITGELYNYKLYKMIPKEERHFIHFYDFMNQEQQKKIITIGDLCVLPSRFESFSIALGETILKGIPCMASLFSGCMDYFGDSKPYMAFNPFKADDLLNKITNFYHLSQEQRKQILYSQQKAFTKATNPILSVNKRLELAAQYKSSLFATKKPDWKIVNDLISLKVNSASNSVILLSNATNDKVIFDFISKFYIHNNLINKVIILNNSFAYIDDIKIALNFGMPILIPNLESPSHDYLNYEVILDYLKFKNDKIVEINLPKLKISANLANKKYTDYYFFNSVKLNLENKL